MQSKFLLHYCQQPTCRRIHAYTAGAFVNLITRSLSHSGRRDFMRRITQQEIEFWVGSYQYQLHELCCDTIKPTILHCMKTSKALKHKHLSCSILVEVDRNGDVKSINIEKQDKNSDLEMVIKDIITNTVKIGAKLPPSCPGLLHLRIRVFQLGNSDFSSCSINPNLVNLHVLSEYTPIQEIYSRTEALFKANFRPRVGVILTFDGKFEVVLLRSSGEEQLDQRIISQVAAACSELCVPFPQSLLGEQRFCLSNSSQPHYPSEYVSMIHAPCNKNAAAPSDVLELQDTETGLQDVYELGLPGLVSADRPTVPIVTMGTFTRMLPDIRDGLTPLQRRIIYAMYQLSLFPPASISSVRNAAIVKYIFDRYHCQFPSPIYTAILHLANPLVCRYPLLESEGNIGNLDQWAAGPAFTKSSLDKIALHGLGDIERDCVDFVDTINGTSKEPLLLPTQVPILLMNGIGHSFFGDSSQVRILPHNLTELCDAILAKIASPELSSRELLQWCKGPDFPSGGTITNGDDLAGIYETGTGFVRLRGNAVETHLRDNRKDILVTSLPFMVGPELFTARVAKLVKDGRIEEVTAVVDESNSQGVRLVVELRRNSNTKKVLAKLFRLTPLQMDIPVKMLAMVTLKDDERVLQPVHVGLAELIQHYIDHQIEMVNRRLKFHFRNACLLQKNTQILATSSLVDNLISDTSSDFHCARDLVQQLGITMEMAEAIVTYNTSGEYLEDRLETAQQSVQNYVDADSAAASYKAILESPTQILEIVKSQIIELRDNYGDSRRTNIISK